MKTTHALAGAVLLLGGLAACSGGSDDASTGSDSASESSGTSGSESGGSGSADGSGDYCTQLTTAFESGGGFPGGGLGSVDGVSDLVSSLAESAPDEVADEWDVVSANVAEFADVLNDAGLDIDDLGAVLSGDIPEGVDATKLADVATSYGTLIEGSETAEAARAIETHGRDACGLAEETP